MKTASAITLVLALLLSACNFNDNREQPGPKGPGGPGAGRPQSRAEEREDGRREPEGPNGSSSSSGTSTATATATTGSGTTTGGGTSTETTSSTDTNTATDPEQPTVPTFAQVKAEVLDPYCTMCHEGANAGEAVDVTSYDALMHASAILGDENTGASAPVVIALDCENSVLWQAITTDRMPYFSDPLPEAQKALVRAWIDGGAKP